MNEEIVTCKYCQEHIQVGDGIYLENDFVKGQMGWFHYGTCKWMQEAVWNEPETPIYNRAYVDRLFRDGMDDY